MEFKELCAAIAHNNVHTTIPIVELMEMLR